VCVEYENKFQASPRSSAKPLSLEQVIDLIDKARGGWGRRDRHRTEQTSGILTFYNYAL
jgi:hypothetical protein